MKVFFSKSFLRFIFLGSLAVMVNFFSRYLIDKFVSFEVSVVLAYIMGMIAAYFMYKKYVFKPTRNSWMVSWSYFVMVNLVGICTCFVVSLALANHLFPAIGFNWHRYEVAHAVGIAVPMLTSFLGHKRFSFRG